MRFSQSGGGYFRPRRFGFFSPAIKILLISNIAFFVGFGFLSSFRIGDVPIGNYIEYQFSLLPIGSGFQIWQLFTYMFLHADIVHLLFNMLPLWMFGSELEDIWGTKKFLIYYITCGVGAAIANLFIAPVFNQIGPTVGASGAVFGILLAFGMLFPDRLVFLFFFPIPIKAKYFVIYYIVIEIFSIGSIDNIAHIAHLGGAAVGLLMLMIDGSVGGFVKQNQNFSKPIFRSEPRRSSKIFQSYQNISDAKIIEEEKKENNQAKIDTILDKISKNGYQSLTADEKKFLFEESKRMH